jgi:hypothetical protein
MELYAPISNGPYAIEPYEAGWAREAIAFVYVTELCGSPRLDLRAQISADGQRWLDFGPRFETITKEGGYFLQLTHFGTWLRLAGEVTGGPEDGSPALVAAFYWDLKE